MLGEGDEGIEPEKKWWNSGPARKHPFLKDDLLRMNDNSFHYEIYYVVARRSWDTRNDDVWFFAGESNTTRDKPRKRPNRCRTVDMTSEKPSRCHPSTCSSYSSLDDNRFRYGNGLSDC